MDTNFRDTLYEKYVSTYELEKARLSAQVIESYWTWCEYKFLPLLSGLKPDDPILELGCGTGHMLEFLRRQGFSKATGIDISQEQVELANERGLNVSVADVFTYLEGKENRFKAIITLDMVEHFTKEELMHLIAIIYSSLDTGGVLIIQTPNGAGLFPHQVIYGDLTHLTILTPESLQQLLRLVGFVNFKFLETGPVPKNSKGRIRLALWYLIKLIANLVRVIETSKSQPIWTENMICFCQKPD